MSHQQVLAMPIRRFWLFSECIDRMKSADDIRAINVAAAVLSQDAYSGAMDSLRQGVGTVVLKEEERDVSGIDRLKAMMK